MKIAYEEAVSKQETASFILPGIAFKLFLKT
jgi:hypothetical protein